MAAAAAVVFTILVRFYANSPADLALYADAQPIAADLLTRAGVEPTFVLCTMEQPCGRPVEGDVLVRVLQDPPDGSTHCGNAAGTGLAPSGLVTLYARCIANGSDHLHVRRPVVAGYSLVHELGHLLLRRRGHAMSGLMAASPNWQYAAAGGLQFAPAEAAAIRAVLEASAPEREQRLAEAAAGPGNRDRGVHATVPAVAR